MPLVILFCRMCFCNFDINWSVLPFIEEEVEVTTAIKTFEECARKVDNVIIYVSRITSARDVWKLDDNLKLFVIFSSKE